ncbi:sensor histidine kinase [Clostridium sardiniense]|uniref:sensor histidine kinase n=1 Tax=Clostridium sardiniense TaxID=29369 RepID=UPI003D32F2E3
MDKLKHRLTLIFILFSLVIIFLIGILANISIKSNFNKYIEDSIDKRKDEIVKSIENNYKSEEWNKDNINTIGLDAIENGLIIKIKDNNGNVVWNAREINNLLCESVLKKIRTNTNKINPRLKEGNTIDNINLTKDNRDIGTLSIEYIGPFYYNESDLIFFETLNRVLIIVGGLAIIISVIIGFSISHTISKTVLKVIKATNLIAEGNYSHKINVKNNIREMNQMINSVNKLADNLEEQDKLRKILTRDISHELRTPLTTIQIQVEALIDGVLEPSEERLKSIFDEIQRLNRLVESLEKLARYESDSLVLNKEKTNIKDLIETLLVNFEKQFLDKNIKIELNLEDIICDIDKDKISQAIINIISNSIKYTVEQGYIEISDYRDKSKTYISIKDNGMGIDEKNIKYIFERFYRADESRTRSSGGVGVGLTISKAIVEAHGGDIKVKSKINKGSEFVIEIPNSI